MRWGGLNVAGVGLAGVLRLGFATNAIRRKGLDRICPTGRGRVGCRGGRFAENHFLRNEPIFKRRHYR